jgi:hypothetical protein
VSALSRTFAWTVAIVVLASVMYAVRVHTEMADFKVYRTAATRMVRAEPLYRVEDGHYQYKYLPAFALAMAPFGWVDTEAAKVTWYALSIALLALFVASSIRGLPGRRLSTGALVGLAILFMGKFYAHELNLGQTNILLGVVLVAALLLAQQGHSALSGVLVGVGVLVKPYAIILLPWLLIASGVEAALAALAVLAVGLVLPAALYGWQGNVNLILEWYRTVTDTTAPNLLVAENVSLATMWAKWLGVGALATRLAVATMVAALGVAAWTIRRRGRVSSPAYLEFGMLMLLVPLISPQGWDYVLLLATPAVLCLLDRFGDLTIPWRVAMLAALGFMSFTIFDVLGRTLYSQLMAINIVSVAALMLVVCLAHLRSRALA